jgi:hypothetical protein
MPSDAATAVQEFIEGAIQSPALLRRLVGFPAWRVPVAIDEDGVRPRLFTDAAGEAWLRAYTGANAQDESGFQGEFLELSGSALVRMLSNRSDRDAPQLAGFDIDPDTATALHYQRAQFPLLQRWADTLDVETTLAGQSVDGGFTLLRAYDGWRVVGREVGERFQMFMAPDGRGRKLAAVFTAIDAADAFVSAHRLDAESVRVVARTGTAVFTDLDALELDGIVFNCVGPTRPIAVAHAFAAAVLDGVALSPPPTPLPARTTAEAHLYMDVRGLGTERAQRAERSGDRVVSIYTVDDSEIAFDIPDAGLSDPSLGPGQSQILGPDELVSFAAMLASGVPADPAGLDEAARRAASARLSLAIACLLEAMKFASDGALPRELMRTVAGRGAARRDPGRFSEARLNAVLKAYRTVRERMASGPPDPSVH